MTLATQPALSVGRRNTRIRAVFGVLAAAALTVGAVVPSATCAVAESWPLPAHVHSPLPNHPHPDCIICIL